MVAQAANDGEAESLVPAEGEAAEPSPERDDEPLTPGVSDGGGDTKKEIIFPSKYVGQLIGPKGATIKQLQADSGGASIEPRRNGSIEAALDCTDSGTHTVVVSGSDAALAIAVPAIKKLLAEAENPDYEGEEGKRLRAEAQKCFDERSRCFDEKQAAFDSNDHEKGHALIKEAGEWGEKAKAANTAAAAAIFKFNNENKGDMFIDMHGLLVIWITVNHR